MTGIDKISPYQCRIIGILKILFKNMKMHKKEQDRNHKKYWEGFPVTEILKSPEFIVS